ncbi:Holliday junction recognition protein [Ctenodactylus gundi]
MEVQDLDSELQDMDPLLCQLRDSRHRFQRRMQQLLLKYDHPFEDDPLVHMSTLTYETPEGLRIWGGKLIKEISRGQIQPAEPPSPLKDDLRRKYLTQVDILLQGAEYFEGADKVVKKDIPMALVPSLASSATLTPGHCGDISANSPRNSTKPVSSTRAWGTLHPGPADMAIAPNNDGLSLVETSSNSCLSNQSFEATDICSVTISDLYAGMLHSMSRLLSTNPSCIISTKTSITQNWNSRRRHHRRSRMRVNETYCKGARPSQRSSTDRLVLCPKPGRERRALRDCQNLLHIASHKPGLKLEKAFLGGNKAQCHKLDPSCKELQIVPQKYSLNSLDFSTVHLDWESRLMALKWLISPVKITSRPRMLQSHAENQHRKIEIKFDKLHQECCPSPGKQPSLAGLSDSWAGDMYRGGLVSPVGPQGSKTHRLSLSFRRAKGKNLSEAFENVGKRSTEADRRPSKSDSLSSLSKSDSSQSPVHSLQTSRLFQGHKSGTFTKAIQPLKAVSVPRMEPLGCRKNHYDEVQEKFDQLHQKYCQTSPQQSKMSSLIGMSPDKASAGVQYQAGNIFRKLNRDPLFQSSHWLMKGPHGSITAESCLSACVAQKDQVLAKRRRLSDSQVCGLRTRPRDPPGEMGRGTSRPEEQVGPTQPNW